MLSVERYEKILKSLEENKTAKVSELSRLLNVTEKTVRLDMEVLEQRGLLVRIHGGAMLTNSEDGMIPIEERQSRNKDIKQSMAEEAIKLIQPHEAILMDGGSTTLAVAQLLGEFPLTVITNDLKVANLLVDKNKIQLIVLGGTRIPNSTSLMGAQATESLKKIRVNRLFFGATGVSIKNGLTVIDSLHVEWKKDIIHCAEKVTLIAESSKFEKVALIQFASLQEVDEVITDSKLPLTIRTELEKMRITVILAKEVQR